VIVTSEALEGRSSLTIDHESDEAPIPSQEVRPILSREVYVITICTVWVLNVGLL
jgi:hypothetical protein